MPYYSVIFSSPFHLTLPYKHCPCCIGFVADVSGIVIAHREGTIFNCFGKVNSAAGRAVGQMCLLGRLAPARGRQLGPGLSCSGSCWGWVAQRLGGGEILQGFLGRLPIARPGPHRSPLLCPLHSGPEAVHAL